MRLVPYHPSQFPQLENLIDRHYVLVPPYAPILAPWLPLAVTGPDPWALHYPELATGASPRVLVVEDDGLLAGAACYSAGLKWIVADFDRPAVVRALLNATIELARQLGHTEVEASGRGYFGGGWFGIPAAWPHIAGGLTQAGFVATERWVLLSRDLAEPSEAFVDRGGFEYLWNNEPAAGEFSVEARSEGKLAGECQTWEVPWACGTGSRACVDLEWVTVERPHRRLGLARHLIEQQMQFQRSRGTRQLLASIQRDNDAMLRLAANLGFKTVMACQKMALHLDG